MRAFKGLPMAVMRLEGFYARKNLALANGGAAK
jgi:hypothetical protein